MSNSSPFDTLKFSTQLREAGFSQEQADTLTRGLQEALTSTVATKADLAEVKAELKTDLAALRTDMSMGFQAAYRHLWLMGMGIIGAMFLLLRYFAP